MLIVNKLCYKRDLKNAQHFAFIQAFITALQAAGFTAARILAKLAELIAAFAIEDQWYMLARASKIIAQRAAADTKRDRFYSRLHRLVLAWAGSGMAQLDAAATALLRPFKLYKVKVNAQMDEETGVLENLITDLSTTEMQAHLATINGTYLFQQLVAAQNQVKSLRLDQGVEESEKVLGALAAARKQCDALYDDMCDLLESFARAADETAPYETFISQWNGTVKIYQKMLNRKSGTSSGNSSNGGGSLTPDPSPEGEGNEGGNTTGTGGGTTPDPGTGGGASPDPSQGGENNGGTNTGNGGTTGGDDNGGGDGPIGDAE
ncbi:MAG: hypothetical protein IK144_01120 [Bacteroidaceae bacterium]|nr:hypothetical protein [Bacteroidaceae bacterium]